MVKRIGGFRRKTRNKLSKGVMRRGKISLKNYLQSLSIGDIVEIVADASVHKGMPFPRFMGRAGLVIGKKGRCYEVEIRDGGVKKTLIIHPVHLRRKK